MILKVCTRCHSQGGNINSCASERFTFEISCCCCWWPQIFFELLRLSKKNCWKRAKWVADGAEVTCCTFSATRLPSFDKCPLCLRPDTVGHDKLLAYSKASPTYQIANFLKHFLRLHSVDEIARGICVQLRDRQVTVDALEGQHF